MTGNHKTFKEDDDRKSKILCDSLGLTGSDVYRIDGWLSLFLQKYCCTQSVKEEQAYAKELEVSYREIEVGLSVVQQKYSLPKLVKYFNILHAGYLRSDYIACLAVLLKNLISEYFKAKRVCYSPTEFIFITEYLKSSFIISPNGSLIETILKINKKDRAIGKSTPQQRLTAVANILSIIAAKGFHHDIVCFKKVLDLATEEDILLIEYLKKYEVKNGQGCYRYIGMVLSAMLNGNIWVDFCLKKELIAWLDSAGGAQPKESWMNKLTSIKEKIGINELLLICQKIGEGKDLQRHYFGSTAYWEDVVAKRFVKSAKWAENIYS